MYGSHIRAPHGTVRDDGPSAKSAAFQGAARHRLAMMSARPDFQRRFLNQRAQVVEPDVQRTAFW